MKDELEQFITNHRDELDRKTPDPAVLARIMGQMQQPKTEQPAKGILIPFRVLRWAAACVVIAGAVGFFVFQQQSAVKPSVITKNITLPKVQNTVPDTQSDTVVPVIAKVSTGSRQAVDSVDNDLTIRKHQLFARVNAKAQMMQKQVTLAALHNMDSPAGRITAASAVDKLKNTGNDVVDALVQTLNQDPNANVRMAALDGLARFYQDAYVRKKLVASLKKQQDPVVQIALIDLLTRMRESNILTQLDQLVGDENTSKAVKDCAYSGILRLRSS